MTGLTLNASNTDARATHGDHLHRYLQRSAMRGCLLASLGGLLLGVALFAALLLTVVVADAFVPMPVVLRLIALATVCVLSCGFGGWLALRPWLADDRERAAAERIERFVRVKDQPVVRGMSMYPTPAGDTLARTLHTRARQRAESVAQGVEPGQAYPVHVIAQQGRWLWLACVGWLVIALVFPNQLMGVLSRAVFPLIDNAPFSLTQLQPDWLPRHPEAGDDVTIQVEPEGVEPTNVDFVRVDENGEEVERFAMRRDEHGGFSHALQAVREPIRFRLEASGRQTLAYTIDPWPPRQPARDADAVDSHDTDQPPGMQGGTTEFDAEAVARRDALGNAGWDALQSEVGALIQALADAEAAASSLDPANAEALQSLAEQLDAITTKAEALDRALSEARAELPRSLSASLSALQEALERIASSPTPGPPTAASSPADQPSNASGSPAQQWLDQAEQATREQRERLTRGLGRSDLPTVSGESGGRPGDGAPVFNDPSARGGYDEAGRSGEEGPLPDAVMQQVPADYREHVAAYFDALARPNLDTEGSR